MSVLVDCKPGTIIDTSKTLIPSASQCKKISKSASSNSSKVDAAKNVPEASQGVKRSRKATGHLIQSNKISDYFLKHNRQ